MFLHKALGAIALGLFSTVMLVQEGPLAAREEAAENVEILARGPVHEAFAQPLEDGPMKEGAMAPKPPPEPIEEQPPEVKPEGDNVQWIPGYWQWDDDRGEFIWVSGIWRDPPPGRKWVPGSWREVDGNSQWVPGFWLPENQDELRYLPKPPATLDEGPSVPAPGDDYSYVPGCWMYRDTRYVWRPGYWNQCRPGWLWQPSHYVCTPAGYLFVTGCWDYPWERRGTLFAPVCFAPRYRPAVWCPSYTVSPAFLQGALFVRSGYRHYWYGDYFHQQYRRRDYTPWTDYKVGRGAHDPAFAYYRTVSRGDNWERDVRGLYAARMEGKAERPPRSLVQQEQVVRNITAKKSDANLANMVALRPLAQSSRPEAKLVEIQRDERERQGRAAAQLREAGAQRASAEKQIFVKKEAPSKPDAAPKSVPLNLPKFERKGGDAPRVESPRNQQPNFTRPTDRPEPKIERPAPRIEAPKVEKPQPKIEQPKIERPAPRIEQPKIEKPAPRIEQPKIEKPAPRIEQPKIERPAPRIEQPKVQNPAPKIEQPRIQNPAPRIEQPRIERPAPRIEAPRSSPPPVARPAPQPAPQVRPAPQQSRPLQQVKPAPQQSRPAPQIRPAPQAAPRQAAPQAKPQGGKPQGGKPRR